MQHNRTTLASLANAADTAWTTIRVLIYYVAPVAFGLIEAVATLQRIGHPIRAYLLIVAVATIGIGIAWGGLHNLPRLPRRRRPVSASVRAVNRRAAWILAVAAVALAALVQLVADHGVVVFAVLAYPALIVGVGLLSAWLTALIGRWLGIHPDETDAP